jgi:hypothetical protein
MLMLKLKLSCDRRSVDQYIEVSSSPQELTTRFFSVLTIGSFLIWDALSDEKMDL